MKIKILALTAALLLTSNVGYGMEEEAAAEAVAEAADPVEIAINAITGPLNTAIERAHTGFTDALSAHKTADLLATAIIQNLTLAQQAFDTATGQIGGLIGIDPFTDEEVNEEAKTAIILITEALLHAMSPLARRINIFIATNKKTITAPLIATYLQTLITQLTPPAPPVRTPPTITFQCLTELCKALTEGKRALTPPVHPPVAARLDEGPDEEAPPTEEVAVVGTEFALVLAASQHTELVVSEFSEKLHTLLQASIDAVGRRLETEVDTKHRPKIVEAQTTLTEAVERANAASEAAVTKFKAQIRRFQLDAERRGLARIAEECGVILAEKDVLTKEAQERAIRIQAVLTKETVEAKSAAKPTGGYFGGLGGIFSALSGNAT